MFLFMSLVDLAFCFESYVLGLMAITRGEKLFSQILCLEWSFNKQHTEAVQKPIQKPNKNCNQKFNWLIEVTI